jgi:hypothetical protein
MISIIGNFGEISFFFLFLFSSSPMCLDTTTSGSYTVFSQSSSFFSSNFRHFKQTRQRLFFPISFLFLRGFREVKVGLGWGGARHVCTIIGVYRIGQDMNSMHGIV